MLLIGGRTMSAIAAGRASYMEVANAASPPATPWMGEVGKMSGRFSRMGTTSYQNKYNSLFYI